ncbi:hypothetical protein ACPCHT_37630 [Nucisporomicrobium flavum]|uniref:hypothetical protein n=1 Tax=Nucisporomicrobium flavum TaxID=2785915 RepID=UPI003C2EEC0E
MEHVGTVISLVNGARKLVMQTDERTLRRIESALEKTIECQLRDLMFAVRWSGQPLASPNLDYLNAISVGHGICAAIEQRYHLLLEVIEADGAGLLGKAKAGMRPERWRVRSRFRAAYLAMSIAAVHSFCRNTPGWLLWQRRSWDLFTSVRGHDATIVEPAYRIPDGMTGYPSYNMLWKPNPRYLSDLRRSHDRLDAGFDSAHQMIAGSADREALLRCALDALHFKAPVSSGMPLPGTTTMSLPQTA